MTIKDTESFEEQRPALISLAYQMLGERAAAEDIVQEAWMQWNSADTSIIKSPAAWLRTVTSRLAIDSLRSARAKREVYVGPWLPEPLLNTEQVDAFSLAQECELALMWAMERLTPEERSAFILRKVFESDYSEIATVLNKSESACRKMVSRAQQKVGQEKPRHLAKRDDIEDMMARFSQACATNNKDQILSLLAPDVVVITDGGGKVRAALRPLSGAPEVTQVILAIMAKTPAEIDFKFVRMNGHAACLISGSEQSDMVSTVRINEHGLIDWIYVMRNPDKLPSAL